MKTKKLIGIGYLLACALTSASAQSLGSTGGKSQEGMDGLRKIIEAQLDLLKRGMEAERSGDDALAESLYREALEQLPNGLTPHLRLAQLYDRQGQAELARREFKTFLTPRTDAVSTSQDDPRVLARFGDLSAMRGYPADARWAYYKAAATGPDGEFHPRLVPANDTLSSWRAAAHAAAAWEHGTHSEDKAALAEAKLASELAPNWWVGRYYLGRAYLRSGQRMEGLRELSLAEARANPEGRKRIKALRG